MLNCVCCADTRRATVVHTTHSVHVYVCVCVLRCWCEGMRRCGCESDLSV